MYTLVLHFSLTHVLILETCARTSRISSPASGMRPTSWETLRSNSRQEKRVYSSVAKHSDILHTQQATSRHNGYFYNRNDISDASQHDAWIPTLLRAQLSQHGCPHVWNMRIYWINSQGQQTRSHHSTCGSSEGLPVRHCKRQGIRDMLHSNTVTQSNGQGPWDWNWIRCSGLWNELNFFRRILRCSVG